MSAWPVFQDSVFIGSLCVAGLAACMLIYHAPPIAKFRQRRRQRLLDQKKRRHDEEERQRVAPLLPPWDRFHLAAGITVSRFYGQRDAVTPPSAEDWQTFQNGAWEALTRIACRNPTGP
jgi:hypothetical protein